jgi:hypothetical protein
MLILFSLTKYLGTARVESASATALEKKLFPVTAAVIKPGYRLTTILIFFFLLFSLISYLDSCPATTSEELFSHGCSHTEENDSAIQRCCEDGNRDVGLSPFLWFPKWLFSNIALPAYNKVFVLIKRSLEEAPVAVFNEVPVRPPNHS